MADTKMKLPFPLDRVSDEQGALDASAIDNMPAKLNDNGSGVQEGSATASGANAHAEGAGTASGNFSHAEGKDTTATGDYSHVEGRKTSTSALYAHAEGYYSKANGLGSHAEGAGNANGRYAHAEGLTDTTNDYEHAQGKFNLTTKQVKDDSGNITTHGTINSVGIGYQTETRQADGTIHVDTTYMNAEEMTDDGKRYLLGVGGYDGTNATDDGTKDEATVMNDTAKSIAPEYSSSSTYAVDARVTYRGKMYKCTTAITTAEAWTASHWSEVDVDSYLTSLALKIGDITTFLESY